NLFRLRTDGAWNNPVPDRGRFGYSRSFLQPGERSDPGVDYQGISTSFEAALLPRFSLFGELPVRFLSPTDDPNGRGLGDVSAGMKWAFLYSENAVASFQLRAYAPTGDNRLHLGSGHASLEPALLGFLRLNDRLVTEGELRLWVPLSSL